MKERGGNCMRRRSALAGTAAVLTAPLAAGQAVHAAEAPVAEIAGMRPDALREVYRGDLFDRFLPFMDRYVIDHENGGFMCATLPDGTNVSTEKRAGYEGRGVWVYSHLYAGLAREQHYLDVAERSVRLLMNHRPDPPGLWPSRFTKEGEAAAPPSSSVNSDLYIADGFQAFARATGDGAWWDTAKDVLIKCLYVYDREDYGANRGRGYLGADAPETPGIRIMDDWMLFLWVATQMLEQRSDMDLLMIVTQCLDTIMNRFHNEETGLTRELLRHDYTPFPGDLDQVVNMGNSIQALWHVMAAAERIDNHDQFRTAADRLLHHLDVAWDDVYGGLLNLLVHVDENRWRTSKAHYVQVEPLLASMMMIERTGDERALEWFARLLSYERGNFHLEKYGHPLWMNGANRRAEFDFDSSRRIGNFHQPRHLLLVLERLDRLIGRNGVPAW